MLEMVQLQERMAARRLEMRRLEEERRSDAQRAINLRLSRALAQYLNRFDDVGEVVTRSEDECGLSFDGRDADW